jgi:hypothetical protein
MDSINADLLIKQMLELSEGAKRIQSPKVHDVRHMHDGEVYDHSQSDEISDGDVLHMAGGRSAIMFRAWPTMVTGYSGQLHRLADGAHWDDMDDGKYKASHAEAQKLAPKKLM